MADNVTLPGTNAVIGTENCTINSVSVQVQQTKIGWGPRDTFNEADTGTPVPVVDTASGTALATLNTDLVTLHTDIATTTHADLGTVNTSIGTTNTSLSTLNTDLTNLHTDIATITITNSNTNLGQATDVAASADAGTFSLIAVLKRMVAKFTTQLPAALGGHGGLVIEGVASGTSVPVSGTIVSKQETDVLSNAGTDTTPLFASIAVSASGVTNLVALTGGKRIRVLQYTLVTAGAVNVKFQSHVTPTDLTGPMNFGANGGSSSAYSPVGLFQTVSGEALDINLSGSVAVDGHMVYVLV